MRKLLVVALVLVLAGAGAGTWSFLHGRDPVVRAERLTAEGKYREALVEMRGASRAEPNKAEYHATMGRLQAKLADPVAAEKEFRTAIQLGADRGTLTPELGEAVLVQGRFRDVLREVPARATTPALLARNLLLRAVAQLSLNDLPGAEATAAEAQARAPESAEASLIAARVAAAHNQPDLMVAKLGEVLKRDPAQIDALLMLEKAMTVKGDRDAALSLATRAVAAAPWSAMSRIELANQLLYRNEDAKAQGEVDAVMRSKTRFIDAIYLHGILMGRRGQLADAAAQFAKLDSVAERIPSGLYFQALIAQQAGNTQTAAEFARRYNQLVPQDPDGMRLRGQLELASGHPADALPPLRRLVELQPKDAEAQDLLGQALAGTGKLAEAGPAFEAALLLAPKDPLKQFHLGAQLFQSGQLDRAAPLLNEAFAADPKIPGLGTLLVQVLLARNDPQAADAVLNKTRAALGNSPELAGQFAAAKLQARDLPGARAVLVEAARRFPDAVEIRVQLARVLAEAGQGAEGLAILQAILAKEPARFSAVTAAINIQTAAGDLPAAIKVLGTAHRSAPRDVPLAAMLADAQVAAGDARSALATLSEMPADALAGPLLGGALARAQLGVGRSEEAIQTYKEVLRNNPGDLIDRGGLVQVLTERKDYAAVASTLGEALKLYPGNPAVLTGMVANAVRAGGLEAGLRQAEALRAQSGTGMAAAFLKGDLLLAANDPKRAAEAFRTEYDANPSLPLLIRGAGAYALAGNDAEARRLLTEWLKNNPKDAEAAQRLAQLDIAAGDWDAAKTSLAVVLDAEPDNPMGLNNLAWVYLSTGDGRALATAQRAYLRDPRPATGDTLGWALLKTGSAKAAVPLLQRAAGQRPNDPGIRYHLAAALAADGKGEDALKLLDAIPAGAAFPDGAAARKLAADLRMPR